MARNVAPRDRNIPRSGKTCRSPSLLNVLERKSHMLIERLFTETTQETERSVDGTALWLVAIGLTSKRTIVKV